MNYHLMIDDKFIDGFIRDVEKVSNPNENIYFVRGNEKNSKYVKSSLVKWIGYDDIFFNECISNAKSKDKVIVHWYDLEIGDFLLKKLNKNVPLYVALWGGEFYEDPYLYHIDWIHDPKTLSFVKKNNIVAEKYNRRPHLLFKKIWLKLNYKKQALIDFNLKKQTINRIDKLLLPNFSTYEIELIKKIYSLEKIETLDFIYDLNVDLVNLLALKKEQKKDNCELIIQLGNSATESNNHVDFLHEIEKFSKEKLKLILPISYGNPKYTKFIKDNGKKIFPNKIQYLETFLPRHEYIEILKNTDVCVMFHNRQQALGNCIPLIMLGKKLFLKQCNPIYHLFKNLGIVVFDADEIKNMSFENFKKPLTEREQKLNFQILNNLFSENKRLEYLKKALE